jgi:glycosyltransferase involved in cell wall biosynthesis
MAQRLSAYIPFYNNRATIVSALQSLQAQYIPPDELFAIDDGSTDGGSDLVEASGFACFRHPSNLGRGSTRHQAMLQASSDLVLCCDATNRLPPDFLERLLPWMDDPMVAAVYGWIQDPHPRGAVSRWRARHLFKSEHPMVVTRKAPLITYGTLLRRSAVLAVGNFNPTLKHTEDAELGDRLLSAGYDIIFDPSVLVLCNVQNSLGEVLERYWRWYAGAEPQASLKGYFKSIVYSLKVSAWQDISRKDLSAAIISLICPHYQFWRSRLHRMPHT